MDKHLKTAEWLAEMMDSHFKVGGVSFGFDTILGFIPGIGDLLSLFFSSYLLWIGHHANLPQSKMIQMILNVVFDFGLGSIPVVGDIADIYFKANLKNLKILQEHFKNKPLDNPAVIEGEVVRK